MKWRKELLLIALAAALSIGGLWWWLQPPTDPMVEDKPLSQWLRDGGPPRWFRAMSREEINAFGPGAVPWLIYATEHGHRPEQVDSPAKSPPPSPPRYMPKWMVRWFHMLPPDDFDERNAALQTLSALGSEAEPAIPVVTRALYGSDELSRWPAALTLNHVGAASWPVVLEALAHGPRGARFTLIATMPQRLAPPSPGVSEAELAGIVRTLMDTCRNSDPTLRKLAAAALGDVRRQRPPGPVFAAAPALLISLCADPDADVRAAAAGGLSAFGVEAESAIPRLIVLLDDPRARVRIRTAQTLGIVDRKEMRSEARLLRMAAELDTDCRGAANRALDAMHLTPGPR